MTVRQPPNNERIRRLREQIAMLAPLAERDPDWQCPLDTARDRLHRAIDEARAAAPSTIDRSTHVVVGDHTPEPRGAPLSEERYAAMTVRPSKGLQDDVEFVTRKHR